MIEVGTKVIKKSCKKFQNGEKVVIVQEFTTMTIPCSRSMYAREKGDKTVCAVFLEGCADKVRLSMLNPA